MVDGEPIPDPVDATPPSRDRKTESRSDVGEWSRHVAWLRLQMAPHHFVNQVCHVDEGLIDTRPFQPPQRRWSAVVEGGTDGVEFVCPGTEKLCGNVAIAVEARLQERE